MVKFVKKICIFIIFRIYVMNSPDNYISSVVEYLFFQVGTHVAYIHDKKENMEKFNNMIINAIEKLQITEIINIEVDGNCDKQVELFITKLIETHNSADFILNTLSNDCLQTFFTKYNSYFKKEGTFHSLQAYPIYCLDESFTGVTSGNDGSYFISKQLFSLDSENYIYKAIMSLIDNYNIDGEELNLLIPFYVLANVVTTISLLNKESLMKSLYSLDNELPFGRVKMTPDNVLSHEIIIFQKERNGLIPHKTIFHASSIGNVWKSKYIATELYSCDWREAKSEKYMRTTMYIGIVLSLTGVYSYQDIPLLNSYIVTINMINIENDGVRGFYIIPYIKNSQSGNSNLTEILTELKEEEITFIFGMTKYLFK